MTFSIGDNVYVKGPQSFVADCMSITGDVVAVHGQWATIDAYVAKIGSGYSMPITVHSNLIGLRLGTPISEISTQPGTPGYSEWLRISSSWGYE